MRARFDSSFVGSPSTEGAVKLKSGRNATPVEKNSGNAIQTAPAAAARSTCRSQASRLWVDVTQVRLDLYCRNSFVFIVWFISEPYYNEMRNLNAYRKHRNG